MNYLEIRNELLTSMQIFLDKTISKLNFDRHVRGIIISDLTGGIYSVDINGETFNISAKSGDSYSVNDIVEILIIRNDFSNKIIDFKVT